MPPGADGLADMLVPERVLRDVLSLVTAALVGCFIAIAYVLVQKREPAGIRIANACVILTVVICFITRVVEDLATAFIVVGALALVRLRAAIEDTREFGFLLLSVAAGLGTGEQRYAIVLAGAALVCALALLLAPAGSRDVRHRLSATLPQADVEQVRALIAAICPGHRLRLRDAGEGRTALRADFVGDPLLADGPIALLRSLPAQDLCYEAEPWRES